MDHNQTQNWSSAVLSRSGLVLIGFLGVAGYFLWTEHQAHLASALSYFPWLLILLCPLMHLFMHRGHGNHSGHERHEHRNDQERLEPKRARIDHTKEGDR